VTRRVRLTDQALVAVTAARRSAAAHGSAATVVDLLVGLSIESDAEAGRRLRDHHGAIGTLADRAPAARWAPPLEVAVAWAAREADPRPPGTVDLLVAALETGGSDLADLLATCALDARALRAQLEGHGDPPSGPTRWSVLGELDAHPAHETVSDDRDPAMVPAAQRIVGQVRAVAGGAVDVVHAAAATTPGELVDLLGPVSPTWLLRSAPADADDHGLEAVVTAAPLLAGGPARVVDLVRAALLTGGSAPAAVFDEALDAARRHDDTEGAER
jgi:hypothetical protein